MIAFLSAIALAQAATAQTAPAPAQAAPSAAPACSGEDYEAFDFWVGEWDVFPAGKDQQVARSKIEKLYNGCAIRENWMPLRGNGGGSLSGYDPVKKGWHQTWFGSAPGPVFFDGGMANGTMVLTGMWPGSGPNGEDGLTRMSYTLQDDGSVRQHGEFSGDHGLSWVTSFDLIYRPHVEK